MKKQTSKQIVIDYYGNPICLVDYSGYFPKYHISHNGKKLSGDKFSERSAWLDAKKEMDIKNC